MLIAERKEVNGRFFHKVNIDLPINYEYYATPYQPYEGHLYFKNKIIEIIQSDKNDVTIIKLALEHQQNLNK